MMENSIADIAAKLSLFSSYIICLLIFPIWLNRKKFKDETEFFTTLMLTIIIGTQFFMNIMRDIFYEETFIAEHLADIIELVFTIGLFSRWFNLDKYQTIAAYVVIIPSLFLMAHNITFEFVYKSHGEWKTYESPGLIFLYLHVIVVAILSLMLSDRMCDKKLTEFQIKIFSGIRLYAFVTIFSAPLLFSRFYALGYAIHAIATLTEFYMFYKAYRIKNI